MGSAIGSPRIPGKFSSGKDRKQQLMQLQKHPSNYPRQQADPSETVSLPPYLDVSPFGPLSGSGNHRGMFFLTFCQQLSVWQTAAGAPPFFPPEGRFLTERQKSHRPDYSIIGPVTFLCQGLFTAGRYAQALKERIRSAGHSPVRRSSGRSAATAPGCPAPGIPPPAGLPPPRWGRCGESPDRSGCARSPAGSEGVPHPVRPCADSSRSSARRG